MTDEEEWRSIPGYEDLYEVSDLGRVRSLPRTVKRGTSTLSVRGKILVGGRVKVDGRPKVELSRDGRQKTYPVHRLVALAFIEPVEGKPFVLHRNGNNKDNRVENLYWGDYMDNANDTRMHGTHGQKVKTTCPDGHPYDEENTRWYRGMRYCRLCQIKWRAVYKERKSRE